jgi:hypothetical protein
MSSPDFRCWKSVRPVRFRSQIFGALAYVVEKEQIGVAELAKYTLELRNKREEKRLLALRRIKSIGPSTKSRRRQVYLTVTEQLVRVLRATGFIVVKGDIVHSTELARELIDLNEKDALAADVFFLERLMNSRFSTYWLYLRQLFKLQMVKIPSKLSKRDANLRRYLHAQGFPITVWSFFILRDLFYEFALLNYVIEEKEEKIFPLYTLNGANKENYVAKIKYPEGYIYYWKKIEIDDFEQALIQAYLTTVGGWDRMADLIELRERVSEAVGISERQFNTLLEGAVSKFTKIKVYPSIGALSHEIRRGYMTKVLSLPTSNRGYPFTLIRISRRGV